jgi:hypothetical protein
MSYRWIEKPCCTFGESKGDFMRDLYRTGTAAYRKLRKKGRKKRTRAEARQQIREACEGDSH